MRSRWCLTLLCWTVVILSMVRCEECSSDHIRLAVEGMQPCRPRPATLPLPWPNHTNIHQMTPTHVSVMRCSGSCPRTGQACTATRTHTKQVG